ncbi:MAG: DNA repair protein rad5 [Chaenotheca gracillima]|nr:MAG: DNA repair protein rad5 [Chaenotheca gracillima]
MSAADIEPPPAKKRRFFADSSPKQDASPTSTVASPARVEAVEDPSSPPGRRPKADSASPVAREAGSRSGLAVQDDSDPTVNNATSNGPLDRSLFASIVGEKVSDKDIETLREVSGDNMERAINMFFDGSWKTPDTAPTSNGTRITAFDSLATTPSNNSVSTDAPSIASRHTKSPLDGSGPVKVESKTQMPNARYVGALGVGAWATRSGTNLLKHGEAVRIERQKSQPSQLPKRGGKSKPGSVQPPRPTALNRRGDIVVRFTNARGEEVGRLPQETAAWVSTLIDQKVCKFDGTCVYVPDRIRTNDTLYLQLRCSLLTRCFDSGGFTPLDNNRTTGIFEAKETTEERDLRLRQIALVKLFEEINLQPASINETTTKHKRQGLLQVADEAEHSAKDGVPKRSSGEEDTSSPPSDEAEDGKELEQDQLDSLYKKAQSFDFNTPAAEPADTFAMDLRQYQKQALHWMMGKEKDEKREQDEMSMHPLWEEYKWPATDFDGNELLKVQDSESFYVNPYSGELSLEFPIQEQNCLGGILADEMGLGKTIEMLSLVHSHKSEIAMKTQGLNMSSVNSLPRLPKTTSSVEPAPCTTLVVAPMSLLAQWNSEAENASKAGSMKSMVYYGSEKTANLQSLCCEANAASAPNLIITSYGVVLSEFNQIAVNNGSPGSHGGLFSLKFFRVILDEAHHIKNRQSKTAKACYEIGAQHRWVLTGTPIVNRLEDLFSLVRFLRVEPWSNFSFWKTFITVPFESKDFIRALDVVQTVLEPLVLRRTKDMKTPDGESLVPLPPKVIEIEEVELSKPEREVYDHIFTRAKRTFAANVEAGTLMKSYTTIFAQILRLRQSCCHPILTRNKNIVEEEQDAAIAADMASGLADDMDLQSLIERFTSDEGEQDANKFGVHVLKQIQDEAGSECPICSEEPMIDQTVTGCWHSACKKCLLDYIEHQKDKGDYPRCFNCRELISPRDVFEVHRHENEQGDELADGENGAPAEPQISLRRVGSNTSAKIGALLTHLKRLRRENPRLKSVVFSQFTSFLDIIEPALTRDKIPFLRFDGSMPQKQRATVLLEFASRPKGVVLLLSLRAGGVGLNLTEAKRVFMMDPWWSFAVEAQAIDRVHRMGQTEGVVVHRFIVKESVEHRMLKIQDRKKFIASSLGMMNDEEKKEQRVEDIRELLS